MWEFKRAVFKTSSIEGTPINLCYDETCAYSACTDCNAGCDLVIYNTTTTNPTNVSNDNGTAMITFSGGTAPFEYFLNGVSGGTTTSPLSLSGLSGSTTYTVNIVDANSCSGTTEFTLGQTSFVFDADYIMLTYQFDDGLDLDTRTRIVSPDVGQNTQADYLGWAVQSQWPTSGVTYLTWGGDNTSTGYESVLLNLLEFKTAFPSDTEIVMDLRCYWYNTVGVLPVNVAATLWKGGSPTKDGCLLGLTPYCWTNTTATSTYTINSVGKIITSDGSPNKALSSGERIATLTYDLITNTGVLDNNDTITPSV